MAKKDYHCELLPYERIDCLSIQDAKQRAGWGITAFELPKSWEYTQGEDVVIAVLDTGCNLDHPDLKDNLLEGISFIKKGKPPEDKNGHGCVSPECLIQTDFGGIQEIESLYDSIDSKEKKHQKKEGTYFVKKTKNIKTYSFDTNTQTSVIGEVESIQKLPINGDVIKIELEGGTTYLLTPWHPVYIIKRRHHKVYDIYRKRADEVTYGDQFIFGKGEKCGDLGSTQFVDGPMKMVCKNCGHKPKYWKGKTPTKCKKCFKEKWKKAVNSIEITEDLSYLAGIILTDGHISNNRLEIASMTPEILIKVLNIAKSMKWTAKIENKRVLIYGKEAVHVFKEMGIFSGNKSLKQDLPQWTGKANRNSQAAFIAGVIDGDGCISKENTKNRITTASYVFAHQMSFFLNSWGISSYVSKPKFDTRERFVKSKHPIYKITHTCLPKDIADHLAHPKKIERSKITPRSSRVGRRVKSVSIERYDGYFYDFTIKKYHNYIADGHFVSNTHVIGTLIAGNNDIGVVGVCPKAKVVPIQVLDDKGNGNLLSVASGVRWAADHGVDIIAMSLGAPIKVQQVRKAIQYAASKGIPTFVAAGNAGNTKEVFYPANYPETIAIGAIDKDFNRADFSNTGENLDFMAPGVDIFSTVPDGWYATLSGTCLAKGSYVYTPNGPIEIENIKEGDIVFAYKSGRIVERPVLFNIYRGKNTVRRLVSSGRDVLATETHKMLTINKKEKKVEWVSVEDLTENHKLMLPRKFTRTKNEYLNNVLNSEFCWLLGFFLGDGWISDTKRSMRVNFATGEYKNIDDKVKRIYYENTGKKLKETSHGWNYDDSTKTAMIIQCLGINDYCNEKTVPLWLWGLNDDKIKSFFDGFYCSDGWLIKCKHPKFGFESSSKDLIRKLSILSEYMGWQHSTIQERFRENKSPNSKNNDLKYSSSLTVTQKEVNGWSYLKEFKISGVENAEKMGINTEELYCASWYKKEKIENVDVYDLTVPDADCFVTNGIITHNSMACPFAVGVAALVLSWVKQGKAKIKLETVQDYRDVFSKYTTPIKNSKKEKFYEGFGIIDPRKLLKAKL